MSRIATFAELDMFCKYFAATATLLMKQYPPQSEDIAWWPGGLLMNNVLVRSWAPNWTSQTNQSAKTPSDDRKEERQLVAVSTILREERIARQVSEDAGKGY